MTSIIDLTSDTDNDEDSNDKEKIDLTGDTDKDDMSGGSKKRPIDGSSSSRKKKKTYSLSSSDDDDNVDNNYKKSSASGSSSSSDTVEKIEITKYNVFSSTLPNEVFDKAFDIKNTNEQNKYLRTNMESLKKNIKRTFKRIRQSLEKQKKIKIQEHVKKIMILQQKQKKREKIKSLQRKQKKIEKIQKKIEKQEKLHLKIIYDLEFNISICEEIEKGIYDATFKVDTSQSKSIIFTFNIKEKQDILKGLAINKYKEQYLFSISYLMIKNSMEENSNSDTSSSDDDSDDDFEALAISPKRKAALEVLGFYNQNATNQEIKKRYFQLAKLLHPDKSTNKTDEQKKEDEEEYLKVKDAYEELVKKLIKLKF